MNEETPEEIRDKIIELLLNYIAIASQKEVRHLALDVEELLNLTYEKEPLKWEKIPFYKAVGSSSMSVLEKEEYKGCTIRVLSTIYKSVYAVTIENSQNAFNAIAFNSNVDFYLEAAKDFIDKECF